MNDTIRPKTPIKTQQVNQEMLKHMSFTIEGTCDQLPAIINALTFVLTQRQAIELTIEGKPLFACDHCVHAMAGFRNTCEDVLQESIEHMGQHTG